MNREQIEAELFLGVVQQLKQKAQSKNAKSGAVTLLPVLQKLEAKAEAVVRQI
jgi:hypothetical protein